MKQLVRIGSLLFLALPPMSVLAQGDIAASPKQSEERRVLTREQAELPEAQQQKTDEMSKRPEEAQEAEGTAPPSSVEQTRETAGEDNTGATPNSDRDIRDGVGDLNQSAVQAGEFEGSIKLPGTGNVSLAIGGFIKTSIIGDSDAEATGSSFLPAYLGTVRPDTEGNTAVDAALTRLYLEARAPVPGGKLRGYVECDLNGKNDGSLGVNMRHAFGSWKNDYGTLLAGHTWSSMMDVKILPEGLTEPTVSGAIFRRQAQVRWSQPLSSEFTFHAAIEDASSQDVFSAEPSLNYTSLPDAVVGLEYDHSGTWHVRLNTVLREIKVGVPAGGNDDSTAWGAAFTGHVLLFDRDKLAFSTEYGEGLGRYLLGIQATSGAAILPSGDELDLYKNWGGLLAYKHQWTDSLRSNAMLGYAHSEPFDWQPGDTFESSMYGALNVMWAAQPYLTLGIEYAYGKRENADGSSLDNHRLVFGVQIL